MARTTAAEPVSTDWLEEFLERWLAAWNSGEPERVLELMTDDIVYDEATWPQVMRGQAEVREFLVFAFRAFPDMTIERFGGPLVAYDGPRAAFWWRARATNTGRIDPPGIPPTGKVVDNWEGADFHEYRDGKVARLWIVTDTADVLRQLGLLPGERLTPFLAALARLLHRVRHPRGRNA